MDDSSFTDERIPYWVELWPASLALAEWLLLRREEIAGRICLDLGCGLGLTSLVGQSLGAVTVAVDNEPLALKHYVENARINGIDRPLPLQMDMRSPALRRGSIWRLWGGDVLYENRMMAPALNFLDHCLSVPGGKAWFAEPGRNIFLNFLKVASTLGWLARPVHQCALAGIHPQKATIQTTIWELSRPGG